MDILGNQTGTDNVLISKVVRVKKSGRVVVRINSVDHTVSNASAHSIKIGDTVLLNKSSYGKLYISGKTAGLSGIQNVKEIYRDGW